MAKNQRQDPHEAPMERFIWREGDLRIIHDPREDRTRKPDANIRDARKAELEERDPRKGP